ncbi:hypothetical protein [Streptomyces sp. NPDC048425]|uniref:hypothetical protein n=1 Tax=Streptomyces sp. NPDC048425 TaxID=3365548 RepID=UPI0037138B5E
MSALGHEIKDVAGVVDCLVDGLHRVLRLDHEVADALALVRSCASLMVSAT